MLRVLIVDDQPAVVEALGVLFDLHDIPWASAGTAREALQQIESGRLGVVIQDMNFAPGETGGREGLELFRRIKARDPSLPVLIITAWTSLEQAVQLVREGAADYLGKPWEDRKLLETVREMLEIRRRELPHEAELEAPGEAGPDLCGLVLAGEAMRCVVRLALRVASASVPALITGPNGSGKERIADLIHANSRRRRHPLVKVNLGAIPEELIEAELFGAEAGAYTGITARRIGRFEAAGSGTMFLDEIGTLSPAGQVKLLRVLESGEYSRLGSSDTRRAEARVLAATNQDLSRAIDEGRFREDLFFRLNVVEIRIPPLRERREDILPLAESFLREHAPSGAPRPPRLTEDARSALLAHDWPGNIRELRNRIQRALLVSRGDLVTARELDLGKEGVAPPRGFAVPLARSGAAGGERRRIESALLAAAGNVSRAAEALGLSRQALYRRMARLGIVLERRPRS